MQTPSVVEEIRDLDTRLNRLHDALNGEALATLCTTASQNGTAALGGHTSTEAMALRTLASVRLISALHNTTLSNCK